MRIISCVFKWGGEAFIEEGGTIFFRRSRQTPPLDRIKEELERRKKPVKPLNLSREEKALVKRIKEETSERNKNNVTRTNAYLEFYNEHPDIHWAFLGHMVSRNGGWNMTDLKGELLARLLSEKEKRSFFSFLERGNWLIFQDAYPQFLLYRESLKQQKPLFFLFPCFHISLFMEVIWHFFWRHPDKAMLTTALIINEQNYLEQRVMQNPLYQHEVFNTIEFKLQDLLSFNQILFPYRKDGLLHFTGRTLHQFDSLPARILLGKRLYALLFHHKERLRSVEDWANTHPHTGSRKDYWPHLFNSVHEGIPGKKYQLRLRNCRLRPGAARMYSPPLKYAWKDVRHAEAEPGDWFQNTSVMDHFSELHETLDGEIQDDYCKTLERLELAALAKKAIFIRE